MIIISDFHARIKAELDTSKVEKQLTQLSEHKVKLDVDPANSTKKVTEVKSALNDTTKTARTFGDTLKSALSIGSVAAITAKGIRLISTAAKDAVNAVKEFDSAITSLRLVTNQSYNDVRSLTRGYNDFAKQLGATTTEVTDSANTWLHQGKSISETNTLIKNSMILSKVANLDAADSATYLTSAMKGFNVATEDTISIVDKLTSVDLVSATSAGGLAEAMSRTAVSANLAGVSMDKLLGYIASVGEVTQKSMSSIGEFYKTLFTRMSNVKLGKLETINEDGTLESLSDVETVLNSLDIKLRQSNDEFRNFGDVLDEVARNWSNYSNVQQAAISKAFAGTRQSENFKVLMENYGKDISYAETSTNSAGTATKKFEAYLISLEAKTKTLQASFESLAYNTISTESIGGVIEATTSLVNFLDKANLVKSTLVGLTAAGAIKTFSLLTSGISSAAIRLNEFNTALTVVRAGNIGENGIACLAQVTTNLSNSQLKAVLSSKALSAEQRIAILEAQGMTTAEAQAALSTMGLAAAESTVTGTTITLSGALKGLWATLMANPLVLVVAGVTAVTAAYTNYKQSLEDSAQAASELSDKSQERVQSLIDLRTQLDNGTQSVDDLTEAFRSQLEAMGYTETQIDTLIGKYNDLGGAIDEATIAALKQAAADAGDALNKEYKAIKSRFRSYFNDFIEDSANFVAVGFNYFPDDIIGTDNHNRYLDYIKELNKLYNDVDTRTGDGVVEYHDRLSEIFAELKSEALDIPELRDSGFYKSLDSNLTYLEDEFGDFIDICRTAAEATEKYRMATADVPMANPEALQSAEEVITNLNEQAETLKASFASIFSNGDEDSELLNYIDSYIDKVSDLQTALTKLRNGGLKPEELNTLYKAFPELAGQADNLDDAISKIIETLRTDAAAVFGEQIDNMITEEDRAAAEEYFGNPLKMGDVTNRTADTMSRLSDTINEFEKGKDILETATEEMKENGEISNDTLKSIIDLVGESENWVDYIKLENGQLKLNTEMWKDRITASLESDISVFENELKTLKEQNQAIVKQIALYQTKQKILSEPIDSTFDSLGIDIDSPRRKSSLPDNMYNGMKRTPYDSQLQENIDAQKELEKNIEYLNAILNGYNTELEDAISGKNSSDDKSSSKSDPKQYNWIETAIDRVKRKIDSFSRTVSSKFKSLSKRNEAAKEEISAITEEIELQQKAYEKYLKLADSVNISDALKERIREGAIEIEEYDEETAELIDRYKEFYEAALDAKDSVDELHDCLTSLYDDEFNRIQTDFENRISLLEYLSNMYDIGISTLEASGYMASTEFYSALSSVTEHNIELLKEELSSLESALQSALDSGEIEKYSEAWYDYQITMNGVKESIAEATLSLAEFAKTMREIEWEYFDYLQDRISQITSESKFLRELLGDDLFDDNGNLTNEGMSVLGLHAMDYNVYMAQADKYAEEIKKIDKELANDPYNTDLIKRREELLALQQDMILAAEDEKQAMIDLVQDGIEAELSSLRDLIDAYKDALDSAKDLHDYQKKINDQSANIAMLEKQFSMLQGDDSEENRATLQKIQDKLSQARDDLSETEYQYYITEQKKLLDNLYNKYELLLNQRIDDVDVLLSELISNVNMNSDTISQTLQITANNVGYTLTDNMRSIWGDTSNQLQGTFGSLQGVVSMYGENFNSQLTTTNTVLNNIAALVSSMQSNSNSWSNDWIGSTNDSYIPDISGWTPGGTGGYYDDGDTEIVPDNPVPPPSPAPAPTPTPTPAKEITVGGRINAGSATIYRHESKSDGGTTQYYRNDPIYTVLNQSTNKYGETMLMVRHHSLTSGVTGYFRKSDVKAYKHGGLVDETGLAWLDGTPQKPETVLDSDDTKNLLETLKYVDKIKSQKLELDRGSWADILPIVNPIVPELTYLHDMTERIDSIRENPVSNNNGNAEYHYDLGGINIDHVEDYDDFVYKLQTDRKFLKWLQAETIGYLTGNKYKDDRAVFRRHLRIKYER